MNDKEKHFMELLNSYVEDPTCPYRNLNMGLFYDSLGQTASAVSYYLRTAERTSIETLQYSSLLRAASCFEKQGTRGLSVRGLLQRAIALLPERPEAYFLLARFYEREKTVEGWVNCYTISSQGEKICNFDSEQLNVEVDYPGKYGILFEKAVSAWWVGMCEESRDILIDLTKNYSIDVIHRQAVLNNLNFMKVFDKQRDHILYNKFKHDFLRYKFNGSENITTNFSEAYQDMFILSILNGKRNGTYLEIGGGSAFYGSNTALLEQSFDWRGVSIDLADFSIEEFKSGSRFYPGLLRKNPCLKEDGLKVNFSQLIQSYNLGNVIDYLQLDCDPPQVTYDILKRIPFDKYVFRVITFEHDAYRELHPTIKEEAKKYLLEKGYVQVVSNIAPDDWRYYEDWWVHPNHVDASLLEKMIVTGDNTKSAEDYILGEKPLTKTTASNTQKVVDIPRSSDPLEPNWSKAIPVIGTTVVNTTRWLKRLILSIDYPVENLFVLNNNGRNELNNELDELKKLNSKYIKNIFVTNMPGNIGVACAWNLTIKSYMMAPFWIVASDDIGFGEGFLKEMYEAATNDSEVGIVHGYGGDFEDGAWDTFLIKDFVIQKYGLFDENTYPAYCEDVDYAMRMKNLPVKRIKSLKSVYYHGNGPANQYYVHGEQTKKSSSELSQKLNKSNDLNIEYLNKKWGKAWRDTAPTKTPFENEKIPVSYTSFDLSFAREKHLGF